MLIVTHVLVLILGLGGGWLGHRKYGSRAEADAKALEATAKKL